MTRSAKKGFRPNPDEQLQIDAEEIKFRRNQSRHVALLLSGVAIGQGAQSPHSTGNELSPCGLDIVLDAVFGEEIVLCEKAAKEGSEDDV